MTQSQPLNPWLTSYIAQYAKEKNRYDIDKYLIEAGYDPSEIELAWLEIFPENSLEKTKSSGFNWEKYVNLPQYKKSEWRKYLFYALQGVIGISLGYFVGHIFTLPKWLFRCIV